jgi:hypothetical protein
MSYLVNNMSTCYICWNICKLIANINTIFCLSVYLCICLFEFPVNLYAFLVAVPPRHISSIIFLSMFQPTDKTNLRACTCCICWNICKLIANINILVLKAEWSTRPKNSIRRSACHFLVHPPTDRQDESACVHSKWRQPTSLEDMLHLLKYI